jgi:excisionase family DNA binding protein
VSEASDRKAMRAVLPTYALLTIPELAAFLGCSNDIARVMVDDGTIPSIRVGKRRHVDPIDAAVHVLAEREGVTASAFWEKHGDAVADHVRRYVARIRRVTAA